MEQAVDPFLQEQLMKACSRGELERVERLVRTGRVNVKAWDPGDVMRRTPLLRASSVEHAAQTVRFLLQEGGSSNDERTIFGLTALLTAAASGQLLTVQWLICTSNSSVSERDLRGMTCHMLAAAGGHIEILKWLLGVGGCRPEERDNLGATVLHHAASGTRTAIGCLMALDFALTEPNCNRMEIVRWLVEQGGSELEEKDGNGRTALHLAAAIGDLEMVQWLIEEKAMSAAERDNSGMTPLLYAASVGHKSMVQWLLKEGFSSVEEKDDSGKTALLWAACGLDTIRVDAPHTRRMNTMQWLLSEGGSTIEERDVKRRTLWILSTWSKDDFYGNRADVDKATACLRTCLTRQGPPEGMLDIALGHFTPEQMRLVWLGERLRPCVPQWLARRSAAVEGALNHLPLEVCRLVQGYCVPSEDELWDEEHGPLSSDYWFRGFLEFCSIL